MPGMLEGRRRDAGRNAGRTSSPDFFRTIWGFLKGSSSSSESVAEASADLDTGTFGTVIDLLCDTLRTCARSSNELALKL